jgi:HEAT repeat protein
MGADDIRALLGQLATTPDDHELRRRAAEALDAAGQRDEVAGVLAPLVNLTGHDDDAQLPCLCKTCLPRADVKAEAAGMAFQRSFAVVGDRVLHFWMLAELSGDRASVRASVASALRVRLAPRPR